LIGATTIRLAEVINSTWAHEAEHWVLVKDIAWPTTWSQSYSEKEQEMVRKKDRCTGLERRQFIKAGAALAGTGLIAGPAVGLFPKPAVAASAGPKRKLIWVVHEVGVWNLPLDVAFSDFAQLAGWEYQKVGSQPQFTVEGETKDVTAAIQAKPDVLVTTMPGDGLLPVLKQAASSVPFLAMNNSFNDTLIMKELPSFFGGFFGEIPEISGGTVGEGVVKELLRQGKKSGIVAIGNPVPGHEFVERRASAMKAAIKAFNEKNGTNFTADEFDDKSLDVAAAVPIYKTYIRAHEADLGGFASLGNFPATAIIQAMKEINIPPNKYPIASIDTAPVTNQGVKDGYVLFIYDNQYYTQAYMPAATAWQYLERGFKGLLRYPTGSVVTKDNIDAVIQRDDNLAKRAKDLGIMQ
jgi:ABC-type sugar transport system substrate-binding protein